MVKKLINNGISFLIEHVMILVLVLFIICGALLSPDFLTVKNIFSILRQMSIIGVLACGQSVAIISGGIDASMGGVLSACVIMYALLEQLPIVAVIIIVLLLGASLGGISGSIISNFKVAPFIITMGMGVVGDGIALLLSSGRPFFLVNHLDILGALGTGYVSFVPIMVIVFFIIAVIGQVILSKTSLGMQWRSIGGNEEAAYWSGVKTKRIKILAYAFSGMMAGAAAIFAIGRTGVADPITGTGLSLDAMSAAVLGGTYMGGGGIGSIIGAILGAFILGIINNLFNILNVSTYWQSIAKGLIIIFAVVAGSSTLSKKPRRLLK
ncbi:MAG: ABC transporter permease [Christensenellales bacterium]